MKWCFENISCCHNRAICVRNIPEILTEFPAYADVVLMLF